MECRSDTPSDVFRTRQAHLTSGLLAPKHTGIPSHLALKIGCKADKAWIGKSKRASSDELFPRVHVRGRLMEGAAVLERLGLPGPEQPPDLQKQKVKDALGCLFFPGQVVDK